jgi:phosphoribosylformylglycinamidine synthase
MATKTCVITGYGINADEELARAFTVAGSVASRVHITDLLANPQSILEYNILAFPGGFSFGDHIGSGKVFAHLFKKNLKPAMEKFTAEGKLILGVCNGFQVLVKMGILPNLHQDWTPDVTLIHNNHGRFEDSWVKIRFEEGNHCQWLKGLDGEDVPIRHGEGRFFTTPETLKKLQSLKLDCVKYHDRNPNGSMADIAGITDPTGRILGLMPHPEAFLRKINHPRWTADSEINENALRLFYNGVLAAQNAG